MMDYKQFYSELFAPLSTIIGPVDIDTIVALIGFDAGGPLNFCTIGAGGSGPVTYVSCELAVREEQVPASFGRYELLATCDDERWVRSVLSDVGRMSLELAFDSEQTLDIGAWVGPAAAVQGLFLEKLYAMRIDGTSFGVLRVVGVTRPELEFAQHRGVRSLVRILKMGGAYPRTSVARRSLV